MVTLAQITFPEVLSFQFWENVVTLSNMETTKPRDR